METEQDRKNRQQDAEQIIAVENQGLGLSNFLSHPTATLLLTSSSYPLFSTEFKRSAGTKHFIKNAIMARKTTTTKQDIIKLFIILIFLLFLLNPEMAKLGIGIAILFAIPSFLLVFFTKSYSKGKKQKLYTNPKNGNYVRKATATVKPYFMGGGTILEKKSQAIFEEKLKNKSAVNETREAHHDKIVDEQGEEKKSQSKSWTLEFIKSIEWKLYEDLCIKFLKLKGYNAEPTCLGADGGIDIKIYDDFFSEIYAIVQCKSYTSYNIGVRHIRELYGIMKAEDVNIGIFFTTSNFTGDALKFARGKKIQLINGQCFIDKIKSLEIAQRDELYQQITAYDYKTPTCPKCGVKMKLRTNKKDSGKKFWGCRNYPKCRAIIRCNSTERMNL